MSSRGRGCVLRKVALCSPGPMSIQRASCFLLFILKVKQEPFTVCHP